MSCPEIAIAHGCNAQGVMGSGVAKAVRSHYPWAFDAYAAECNEGLRAHLTRHQLVGRCIPSHNDDKTKWVFNLITQERYGRDPAHRYMSYDALERSLRDMDSWFKWNDLKKELGIPMIGAGLGNGNWNIIQTIIHETLPDYAINVYVMEKAPDESGASLEELTS